jgi:hypothetical protein
MWHSCWHISFVCWSSNSKFEFYLFEPFLVPKLFFSFLPYSSFTFSPSLLSNPARSSSSHGPASRPSSHASHQPLAGRHPAQPAQRSSPTRAAQRASACQAGTDLDSAAAARVRREHASSVWPARQGRVSRPL